MLYGIVDKKTELLKIRSDDTDTVRMVVFVTKGPFIGLVEVFGVLPFNSTTPRAFTSFKMAPSVFFEPFSFFSSVVRLKFGSELSV